MYESVFLFDQTLKTAPKSEVASSPALPPSARLISSISVGSQHLRSSPAVSLNFDTSISMRLITGVKCLHYPSNLSKRAALSSWDRLFSDVAAGETNSKPKRYKYPAVYEPFGPKAPPSEKVLQLADRIAALPPEELKQIGPTLHLRLNQPALHSISSQGFSFGVHSGASAKKDEEKKEEKTAFDVKLEKFDAAAKIKVIKEVRAFTNLGLKEAKDLVEKAPAILKQGVTKEEANDIIEKIKAAGGVAVME